MPAANATPTPSRAFEIFLACPPGLEPVLLGEVCDSGFASARPAQGGVTMKGGWADVWRANLVLRGASRVTAGIAAFRAEHLSQLDKRSRRVAWSEVLLPDVPVRVEATCRKSKIYHSGAAAERVARAVTQDLGAPVSADAEICIRVRIENDMCSIGIDTSGELLHKRGHKQAVNAAPMRETLAALFLRQCGFTAAEPVLDPMCGSGTFVIEAAEMALGLDPGRSRHFAFEQLATFDATAWAKMREAAKPKQLSQDLRFYGRDRDPGAIRMGRENAERAGVSAVTQFEQRDVADLARPHGPAGLVIVNPPYGERIGDKKRLAATYRGLGQALRSRFSGWRVGLITSERMLAEATGLPFEPPGAPVPHGGLRVTLYLTGNLG